MDVALSVPLAYYMNIEGRVFSGVSVSPGLLLDIRFIKSSPVGIYTFIGYFYDGAFYKKQSVQMNGVLWRIGLSVWVRPQIYFGMGINLRQVIFQSVYSNDISYIGTNLGMDIKIGYNLFVYKDLYVPLEFLMSAVFNRNGTLSLLLSFSTGFGFRYYFPKKADIIISS